MEPRKQILRICNSSGVHFRIHDLRCAFLTDAKILKISVSALERPANDNLASDVTAGYIISDVERLRAPVRSVCSPASAVRARIPKGGLGLDRRRNPLSLRIPKEEEGDEALLTQVAAGSDEPAASLQARQRLSQIE